MISGEECVKKGHDLAPPLLETVMMESQDENNSVLSSSSSLAEDLPLELFKNVPGDVIRIEGTDTFCFVKTLKSGDQSIDYVNIQVLNPGRFEV